MREIKCLDEKPKIQIKYLLDFFVFYNCLGIVVCKQLKSAL